MISKNLDIYTVGQSYVDTIDLTGQLHIYMYMVNQSHVQQC